MKINLKDYVNSFEDFPKKGIIFRDISPIFQNINVLNHVVKEMYNLIKDYDADYLCGIDSRGFLIASPLAMYSKIPLLLIRKKGKLPPPTIKEGYDLEYGDSFLEISKSVDLMNKKVIIIDDVVATGGTALASIKLLEKLHANIVNLSFLINLTNIPKKNKLITKKIKFLISY